MVYGRLFKKLQAAHPEFKNLSANKCSLLTYKELKSIAKALYSDHKITLKNYQSSAHAKLAGMVYRSLCEL